MTKKDFNKRLKVEWVAIGVSIAVSSFWAFWGIIENFHEGWFYESFWQNLGLMVVQYLSPMLIFLVISVVSIYRPRVGAILHGLIAVLAIWFFRSASFAASLLIITPLLGLGILYWFSRLENKNFAAWLAIGLPLLTLSAAGISPAIRVSQRFDDGIFKARLLQGNGVELIWAPEGPGWPDKGGDWNEAQETCRQLSEDGLTLVGEYQDIWRLPSVKETVLSMTRRGENSGGVWDPEDAQASYQIKPDKESPLWKVHSPVIYWWTASEQDVDHAYIIAYDGKVWPRSKDFGPDYLGFRCVKTP